MEKVVLIAAVIIITFSKGHSLSLAYEPLNAQPGSTEVKGQHAQARRMALSIIKELEKHSVPEDKEELEEDANAERIIQEVNAEYDNVARQINRLNSEKRRLRYLQKEMKKKRRLDILRNLRQYYRRQ